jgi:hypothetical protein
MNTPGPFVVLLACALTAGCNTGRSADTQAPTAQNDTAPAAAGGTEAAAPARPEGGDQLQPLARGASSSPAQPQAEPGRDVPAVSAGAPGAQAANEPPAAVAPRWREITVAAGTPLPLELTTALSSETATVETPVRVRLRRAVTVDSMVVIPAGTAFTGHVTDVARAGRVQGRARLAFTLTEATIDGTRETLRTEPVTFQAEATKGEDATKIGAGAGVGAVIGGIVGGGSGAAKGAAIGGAAGTGAVLATRGREVELASGTDITATLASPLTVRVDR